MKQHIFSWSRLLLVFISMVLSFFACRQDFQEPINKSQTFNNTKVQLAKAWFEAYQKSGVIDRSPKFHGMEVQWDKALATGNAVEVPFKLNGEFNFPSLYNNNLASLGKQRLVIYNNGTNGKIAYVFDYMPSMLFSTKIEEVHPVNFKYKKFDGMLAVHTFDSDIVRGFVWKDGSITQQLETKLNGVILRDCSVSSYTYACGRVMNGPLQCSTGYNVVCWTNGGSFGGSDGSCICCYAGCGDKDTDDSQYYPPSEPPTTNAIDFVTTANLSPCNTNVWNKLANTSSSTPNTTALNEINTFIKIFASSTSSNLLITEARFINENTGQSNFITEGDVKYIPSTNTYQIRLNTNVVENASQEFIAVTLMHEVLHAYLSSYLGLVRNNDAQHPSMVETYCVEFMADALMSLFPTLSRTDAIGLSWSGLDATPSYQAKPISERFDFQTINNNYKSRINGTPCQ